MDAAKNINVVKMENDEFKNLKDFPVTYGVGNSEFGNVLMGTTDDKVCYVAFYDGEKVPLDDLKQQFPKCVLDHNDDKIVPIVKDMFSDKKINVLLRGTPFETTVLEHLVNLKKGSTYSYEDVAKAIGNPKAIRAVAKVVAKNRLAYCVPCHRVISKSGGLSKYKWGASRKMKLLKHENAI